MLVDALVYSMLAGAAIPLGAALGLWEKFCAVCSRTGLDHAMTAFGGGVLIAAVALVLLPDGAAGQGPLFITAGFGGGALVTLLIDRAIENRGSAASNLLAMLMDFVPEAIALGAIFSRGGEGGPFLALLIGLQNVPEGFNSMKELGRSFSRKQGFFLLLATAFLGPLAAWVGVLFLGSRPDMVAFLFLFAAGGIVYLVFHDIAPQALSRGHWLPTSGAIFGVLVGLIGKALLEA